jgi:hypothetical protein
MVGLEGVLKVRTRMSAKAAALSVEKREWTQSSNGSQPLQRIDRVVMAGEAG